MPSKIAIFGHHDRHAALRCPRHGHPAIALTFVAQAVEGAGVARTEGTFSLLVVEQPAGVGPGLLRWRRAGGAVTAATSSAETAALMTSGRRGSISVTSRQQQRDRAERRAVGRHEAGTEVWWQTGTGANALAGNRF